MSRLIASALAALALGAMIAPSAFAEKKTVSMKVSYAGLDLSSPADAQEMLGRLQAASYKVCRPELLGIPDEMLWEKACRKKAMAGAVQSLNAPLVSAMYLDPGRFQMASR